MGFVAMTMATGHLGMEQSRAESPVIYGGGKRTQAQVTVRSSMSNMSALFVVVLHFFLSASLPPLLSTISFCNPVPLHNLLSRGLTCPRTPETLNDLPFAKKPLNPDKHCLVSRHTSSWAFSPVQDST